MEFLRTLLDALKLAFLVVPRRPARRIGPGSLWLALALALLCAVVQSWLETPPPRLFTTHGLGAVALLGICVMLVAYVTVLGLERPAIWWPLATLLVLALVAIAALVRYAVTPLAVRALGDPDDAQLVANALWFAWSLLAVRRIFDYLEPHRSPTMRGACALLVTLMLVVPVLKGGTATFFQQDWLPDDDSGSPDAPEAPAFDAESVMTEQHDLVDAALARLAPQRPGVPDLYVVAFGGDGSENVFRNEVEYVERLFGERFGAANRTLGLVNNPATVDSRPLATLSNLRRALAGVGARADAAEDLVLLFLTTHGAESHELYVALDPLPLTQIRPADLADAIDDAGIGWRVVVVSACYSGGFIPALKSDDALVIAAARHDRTSFGCGSDSEITYFGKAFFAEALNATGSFTDAFAQARKTIHAWEEDEDNDPSDPQIASNPAIEAQLAKWLATVQLGPPVEFKPAVELEAAER